MKKKEYLLFSQSNEACDMVTAINEEPAILARLVYARELASAAGCLGLDRMYGELVAIAMLSTACRVESNTVHRNVDEAFQNANAASENVPRCVGGC